MDIDTIEPGVDFAEVIDQALDTCDIVITVIGRSWLQATDAKGRRRLEHPDDFVRLELQAALTRSIRVIPALVQGAEMPSSEDLPDDLAGLARRNAIELSDARWRFDMDRLIAVLDRVEQQKADREGAAEAERRRAEEERLEQERALAAEQVAKEAADRAEHARQEEEKRLAAEREAEERRAREQAEREAAEREAAVAAAAAPEREQAERESAPIAPEVEGAPEPVASRRYSRAAVGRGIATVGLLLFLIAMWTPLYRGEYRSFEYWNIGHGTLALSLGVCMAVAVAGSVVLRTPAFDVATAAFGLVTSGFGLSQALQVSLPPPFGNPFLELGWFDVLRVGAYLGFIGPALVVVGGSTAASLRPASTTSVSRRSRVVASAVAGPGSALVVASVWTRVFDTGGRLFGRPSYWDLGYGHAVAILTLVLGGLAVVALAAGWVTARRLPYHAALSIGLVALGTTLRIPLSGLELHAGIALAFVAAMLIVAGGWAMSASHLPSQLRLSARGVVGAGVALLFLAIWLDTSYWDFDGRHQRAIFLIVICLVCAAALVTSGKAAVVASLGLVALGFTIFVPLTGGWSPLALGPALALVGSVTLVAGALAAVQPHELTWPLPRPTRSQAIALLGIGLVLVSIWQDATDHIPGRPGSFWQTAEGGGFLLLVGLLGAACLLGRLVTGIEALAKATHFVGLVTLGFALNPLLDGAFRDWQYFRAGTWLLVAGALLIVAGTTRALSRRIEAPHALTPGPA